MASSEDVLSFDRQVYTYVPDKLTFKNKCSGYLGEWTKFFIAYLVCHGSCIISGALIVLTAERSTKAHVKPLPDIIHDNIGYSVFEN